jgi:hypothetical protein
MILTMLGTRAIADVEYTLSPVMHASPKKSPWPRIPRTAPLRIGNQREFHDSSLNVVNIGARFSLGDNSFSGFELLDFLRWKRFGKKVPCVETASPP